MWDHGFHLGCQSQNGHSSFKKKLIVSFGILRLSVCVLLSEHILVIDKGKFEGESRDGRENKHI